VRIIAIVEARMTSSRLPGKVLLPAAGRPLLQHLVERLRRVPSLGEIVLATTVNLQDAPLVEFAGSIGISCFRGSEQDVMERVIGAASSAGADVVVEITGDCPVIDPAIVQETIDLFLASDCDYASNVKIRSYPDGMDTQVFPLDVLRRSAEMTNHPTDREHVTWHIRNHPEIFRSVDLVAPPELYWPELGLTLDEMADYQLLRRVIEWFGDEAPYFSCGDAIQLLRGKPGWIALNQNVRRWRGT
jgi:spore coat polysaccharide biosynthesis protein SpsF